MPIMTCPTADHLIAFQAGKLSHHDLNEVASHVESCAVCLTVLERVSTMKDTLVKELRHARSPDDFAAETNCKRAVAHAAALMGDATHTRDDTKDADPPVDLALKTLGKYQLLEKIGQGGMGTVYKAFHALLKRIVALKVLPPNRLKDPQAVSRFRREIEAAGRLDHPHIVRTSDADAADGQHFLVMEWLAGQDLAKYVRERGPLPIEEGCDFIQQAALGLECAHQHGMVHRDVKPSNLLVTTSADGTPLVKVLDLGLALLQANDSAGEDLTSANRVIGTYDYIAPEQAMNAHEVDARADIYSLGCTFYFLLTARAPFQGKSETQKLLSHQRDEPTPLAQFCPHVPCEVVAVISKMMAKDPAHRFASMNEVADAIKTASHASLLTDNHVPSTTNTASAPTPRRLGPLFAAAAALLVLLVGGVTLYPQIVIRIKGKDGETEIKLPKDVGVDIFKDNKRIVSIPGDGKPSKDDTTKPGSDAKDAKEIKKDRDAKADGKKTETPLDPMPVREKGAVALEITTKLGIKKQVEIHEFGLTLQGSGLVSFLSMDTNPYRQTLASELGMGRICLDQGKGFYVFIPVRQVASIEAEDKMHVITLTDGTKQQGLLLTLITAKDGKTQQLSDAKTVKVITSTPEKPADTKTPRTLLTHTGSSYRLSSWALRSGKGGFGQRIRMTVSGNTSEADLSDFDKAVVTATANVDGKWRIALTAPAGQETAGILDTVATSSGALSWCLIGETRNGWLVALFHWADNPGFSLQKIKQDPLRKTGLLPSQVEHSDGVAQLAISREGTKVLTYTSDNFLWFWEWDADKNAFRPRWKKKQDRGGVQSISLDPSGSQALVSEGANLKFSSSPLLNRLDTETEQIQSIRPGLERCGTVAISPDGRRYLVGDPEGFGILVFPKNLDKNFDRFGPAGELLRKFTINSPVEGNKNPVYQFCFSSDGERILSNGNDHTVRLWNSTAAEELKKLPRFAATKQRFIALSPDGKRALISQDNDVQVWDLSTGKSIHELKGHKDHVSAVAYGPDGSWAVSASRDQTLRVWDVATGKERAKLDGHTDDVTCVAVTSEGRILSASRDKTLRVWASPK